MRHSALSSAPDGLGLVLFLTVQIYYRTSVAAFGATHRPVLAHGYRERLRLAVSLASPASPEGDGAEILVKYRETRPAPVAQPPGAP